MNALTKTEKNVARLVVQGFTNQQIATKLCKSVKTIENQLTSIYSKLEIKSRSQLIVLILQGPEHLSNESE